MGCLATAGNEPSGDNTKGKCNKSLAEIGKILDKRGRPSEKEALREQERDRDTVKKSWSTGAWLSTLTDFQAVTVLCVGHFVLGLVSFFAKLLDSDFIFPPPSPYLSVLLLHICQALQSKQLFALLMQSTAHVVVVVVAVATAAANAL